MDTARRQVAPYDLERPEIASGSDDCRLECPLTPDSGGFGELASSRIHERLRGAGLAGETTNWRDSHMKSDTELQRDVSEELRWDPRVVDDEIGISVRSGVVTLTGSVPSFAQKLAAVEAVERVAGVRAVAQELSIKAADAFQQSDTDLAHQILNTLAWDIEVPHQNIKARVENGWVTLEGEVDWQFQRSAAERVVRYLIGVKGVSNLITIKSRVSKVDVAQHIKDALRRSADADSKKIQVDASGGKVILSGTVRSWSEKADAERAAWNTSGVTAVDDRLAIVA